MYVQLFSTDFNGFTGNPAVLARNFFEHLRKWTRLKSGSPFFRHCATFFRTLLPSKGPRFNFLKNICNKLDFQKAQRVSPLTFFGTMRLLQNSHFSTEIRFSIYTQRVMRYNRIFAVISELYCVLLRRRGRFENRSFSQKRPTHILKTALFDI